MVDSIQFGSQAIDYIISFTSRKTLGITVTPELEILVKAPLDTPVDKIREKIRKKAPWIIKQHCHFLSFHPKTPPRRYVTGETHLYLGRQYRLEVLISEENLVRYSRTHLTVNCQKKSQAAQLLQAWYLERANLKFQEIAAPMIERFKRYNVTPQGIYIRQMPTRWGSCTTKGKIILNPELIKAPRACVEYVIIHEFCHLIHRDHTRKFFELQTKEMPDWEKWKGKLDRLLA